MTFVRSSIQSWTTLSSSPAPDGVVIPQCASPSESLGSSSRSSAEDMIIAVMGPTGAGKSTFINFAAGFEAVAVGHHLTSCTSQVQEIRCRHPQLDCDVVFVDTPGFDDTNIQDSQILARIANWLSQSYRKGTKLAGILYFHRISDVRVSNSVLRNFSTFQKLCGKDAFDKVILVTTHWDPADSQEEKRREQRENELRKDFWKTMLARGSQMHRFQYSAPSAWGIINALTEKRKVLQIQAEMVDQGLDLEDTKAGRTLFSWLGDLAKILKGFVRQLETLLKKVKPDTRGRGNGQWSIIEQQLERRRNEYKEVMRERGSLAPRRSTSFSSQSSTSESTDSTHSFLSTSPRRRFRFMREGEAQVRRSRSIADMRLSTTPDVCGPGTATPLTVRTQFDTPKSLVDVAPTPCDIPNLDSFVEVATGREPTLKAKGLTATIRILDVARNAVTGIPVPGLQSVVSVALRLVQILDNMNNTDHSLIILASNAVGLIQCICDQVKPDKNLPEEVVSAVEHFNRELMAVLDLVDKIHQKGLVSRYILQPLDHQVIMDCNNAMKLALDTLGIRLQLVAVAGKKVGERQAEELSAAVARIEAQVAEMVKCFSTYCRGTNRQKSWP